MLWGLICSTAVFGWLTCEQLPDLHIGGLAQESHQGRDAAAVLQGDLVVVVGFAIDQVPQGPAGGAVHIRHTVVQQVHQQLDATLPADLRLAWQQETRD